MPVCYIQYIFFTFRRQTTHHQPPAVAACNPRNPWKAAVFGNESHAVNVYGDDVEVDYRGYEVTVENFLRLLTGKYNSFYDSATMRVCTWARVYGEHV